MTDSCAIEVSGLVHEYGSRRALDGVTFTIQPGEIFAFLGPNGGGKTTLFRLLSTLLPLQAGQVRVLGHALPGETAQVRRALGVVFQAPSLDKKLSVRENVELQGHLYGLRGPSLAARVNEMLERLGVADRAGDLVETLSGGLRRRVELAKGMLHRPRLLLLDEPSTGLDPGARSDLWQYLKQLRAEEGVTVVLTTHLLEEADKVDRLAILNRGQLVALDTPDRLRESVGGDTITLASNDPAGVIQVLAQQFQIEASLVEGSVRFSVVEGHRLVARLFEALPGKIQSITLGKPTLEDVFIARTGHRLWSEDQAAESAGKGRKGRRP